MQNSLSSFARQPLLHFVVLGALIFTAYEFIGSEELDEKVIVVDDIALLNFMQYQASTFEPELFAARFGEMGDEERQALIEGFVLEEALYREALLLGLDNGDYIIRQRLVQKLDYLLEDSVVQSLDPSEEALNEYYTLNSQDYQIDAVYTFTHVFFSIEGRGEHVARAIAEDVLETLNTDRVSFNNAEQYGERYPFLQNYVDRTFDYVRSNFDANFMIELDSIEEVSNEWHGPLTSRYGSHLVMLTKKQTSRLPQMDEIRVRVLDDYRFEMTIKGREEAQEKVVERYQVELR